MSLAATDSPRWCATCNAYGDHHTERHPLTGMTDNHRRWNEAVPKLCMALSEAGYPARPIAGSALEYDLRPPEDVLQKAFELCGIGDMWHDDLPPRVRPSL